MTGKRRTKSEIRTSILLALKEDPPMLSKAEIQSRCNITTDTFRDNILYLFEQGYAEPSSKTEGYIITRKGKEFIIKSVQMEHLSSDEIIDILANLKVPLYPNVVIPAIYPLLKQRDVMTAEWFIQKISDGKISIRSEKIANDIIPLIRKIGDDLSKRLLVEYIRMYLKRKGTIANLGSSQISKAYWVANYPSEEIGAVLEELMLLDDAIQWYTSQGLLDEATRIRRTQAEQSAATVSQKIVHGNEITTIQDSVVNKSSIGTSAGEQMLSQLERLGALKQKGLLSDDQFEAAKEKLIKS